MNIAYKYYTLKRKCSTVISNVWFTLWQKPLWKLSYNGNGNKFICRGKILNGKVMIEGTNNQLVISPDVFLKDITISIKGNGHSVIIEEGSAISEGGLIRVEDQGNAVHIGKNCRISEIMIAAADMNTEIIIGDNSLISARVAIRSSDSHSILNADNKRINPGENVMIGKSVWIGYGATILKGSVIGDNCIIGTQTVVPGKNIPDGSIVAGNPGKIVKNGIHWCKERIKIEG